MNWAGEDREGDSNGAFPACPVSSVAALVVLMLFRLVIGKKHSPRTLCWLWLSGCSKKMASCFHL